MPSLKRNINCPRRMVVYAVFDVLERMGCIAEQATVGDIRAETNVLIYRFPNVFGKWCRPCYN